jgi:TolA-binding protein
MSGSWMTVAMVLCLVLQAGVVSPVHADEAKKRQELLKKIQDLEREKLEQQEKLRAKEEKATPTGKTLVEIVTRYEKILEGCATKKSERCADVMATLGSLYYDQAKDDYIQARNRYERDMEVWEQRQVGAEPVNPIPDYSKPLKMYKRFAAEYPEHPKLDEAQYQIGTINLVLGAIDVSRDAFEALVRQFPNSRRASSANFRLADFAFLEHDYTKALKHLQMMNMAEVPLEIVEMAHYRKAEILYNMGEFERAAEAFFDYREKCESGAYRKCDFRDESLEFMAISFSDMPDGATKAIKFFKKVGGRPYEDEVIYTVGMKNRSHGQYDDAIIALGVALKRFPYYHDAPLAQQALIECFLIKKKYDDANGARERLVDYYQPGTEWYQKNSTQKAVIEQANSQVKRALSSVAKYYHILAQKQKERTLYEKALKRYLEYFAKFPEDKWGIYELKAYVAEIYGTLNMYSEAAEYYDFVASQDLSTYPKFVIELDTLGFSQEEIEKMKQDLKKQHESISQEDAGYNAIVALDHARKKAIAKSGLTEDKAYSLPETQSFLAYIRKFQERFPQSKTAADVLYLGANVHYSAKAYPAAISEFQHIVNNYPTSPLATKSLRLLANCYVSSGDYDLALAKYRELLAKQKPGTKEHQEVIDLAAGAMYKKADGMKKDGNFVGAADAFKAIASSFPNSKVTDRGWYEAGDCYEQAGNLELSAATFEEFTQRFAKSELVERAYIRAAESYKKTNKLDRAAKVYVSSANAIKKADFAVGMLAAAAQCYTDLKQFGDAGKTYELIYERYSTDPKTPISLYNAGLIFEKGGMYGEAIKVYKILAERFQQSQYAAEAFFSIGLCHEKTKDKEAMAKVFSEYAVKYPDDRYKQVEALAKSADAYYGMGRMADAEKNYTLVTVVHKEYGKKADMDLASVARAHYRIGELRYKEFMALKLDGKTERLVRDQLAAKTKALETAAKPFAKAIEIGVEEWTVRGTYMIGQGFVDMAAAVAEQRLFGRKEQQIVSKIKILSSLEKYYDRAMGYFYKNIDWAYEQGVKGEYVDRSKDRFMELAYRKGSLLEQVGELFKNSPIPGGMDAEERRYYQELLEEKYLASLDAALPKYEEAMQAAASVGIAESPWLEKVKERILSINPGSEALNIKIVPRVAKAKPKAGVTPQGETATDGGGSSAIRDARYERNMRRIKNIASMEIPLDDKIKQLGRIEMEAKRGITMEEEAIKRLKGRQAGKK